MVSTCRDEILEVVSDLAVLAPDGSFSPQDVIRALVARGTRYAPSTVRTHVVSRMCANAPDHHALTWDDLTRVAPGRYRLRNDGPQSVLVERSTQGPPSAVVDQQELPTPPGDSSVQREAETVMLAAFAEHLNVRLEARRIRLSGGDYVDVDGVSDHPRILVEAWAHQGPPKSAQRNKVLADAFKLAYLERELGPPVRLVLLFSDAEAARQFRGRSWYASAIRQIGIEIALVELPEALRARVQDAQRRQYR
jgi:hypothetical protein